jgi:hypothetical protein
MDRDSSQPQRMDSEHHDAQPPRQEYHNSSVAIGVVSHALKLAGSLSPLLILEFVKEPTKAHRWIRIASNRDYWSERNNLGPPCK